jgi:hypothetical protein
MSLEVNEYLHYLIKGELDKKGIECPKIHSISEFTNYDEYLFKLLLNPSVAGISIPMNKLIELYCDSSKLSSDFMKDGVRLIYINKISIPLFVGSNYHNYLICACDRMDKDYLIRDIKIKIDDKSFLVPVIFKFEDNYKGEVVIPYFYGNEESSSMNTYLGGLLTKGIIPFKWNALGRTSSNLTDLLNRTVTVLISNGGMVVRLTKDVLVPGLLESVLNESEILPLYSGMTVSVNGVTKVNYTIDKELVAHKIKDCGFPATSIALELLDAELINDKAVKYPEFRLNHKRFSIRYIGENELEISLTKELIKVTSKDDYDVARKLIELSK